jgi:MtrB/PioB family decaheme-associated outer membrane protein
MKVRSNILSSRKAALLGGAILMAMFPAAAALAADQLPVKAAPAADLSGWESSGTIEAGTNIWLKKPGDGYGKTSTDPFWLTPSTTDSRAKMDEYGKVPRSVFLSEFGVQAGSRDGRYALDFWADYVGTNFQRYYLGLYEPGRQYFNMGWDETPHLLSSSAKSIFGGVGTSRLTVDAATRTFLQANLGPATQTQAQRNAIENYINNTAPMTNITLETKRDKFTTAYRNTMLDNWDFNVDYSHEHRTGTRPLGIGYGYSPTTAAGVPAAPRPSSGSIEVAQPLDDRTQNANAAGEYSGTTPWGTGWNTSVKYMGSFYNNSVKSIDVDNPFCITCTAANGVAVPAGTQIGPNLLRYALNPDNSANGLTWNTAVNLPIWKSRYVSTLQYTQFRQNDGFLNDATNGITTLAPYPAASLNGQVNAFLSNNVLTSHITNDVSNTARVRYYDRKDNTPTLAFANYVFADNGTATTTPLTRDPNSYSKLNLEDQLKWQINRTWAVGGGPFFERFVFENGEVDSTNESGAKAFVNATWRLATWRSSVDYSQRRYNSWLATSTDPAAQAMRYFFVANRDRTKMNTVVELAAFKNVTISPNGGLRYDNYPGDQVLSGNTASAFVPPLTDSVGTKYDRSWNLGTDIGVRVTPELRLNFGYNHEEHYLRLQSCCGGAAGTVPFNDSDKWASDITQKYNTYMASAEWKAIPGKLDFKADYVAAISNEANNTAACSSGNNSCVGLNTGQVGPVVWPDEHNIFQRFSLIMKYYVDPMVVKQMGWFGEVTLKARYTWERNQNSNWATDNFSPYSPSAADAGGNDITNGGRSLFLAYNNPNYQAQILALSLGVKW